MKPNKVQERTLYNSRVDSQVGTQHKASDIQVESAFKDNRSVSQNKSAFLFIFLGLDILKKSLVIYIYQEKETMEVNRYFKNFLVCTQGLA